MNDRPTAGSTEATPMDPKETARMLRALACVDEALGHGPAPDLAARIAARLDELPADRTVERDPHTRRNALMAAAVLLLGIGVTAGVLMFRSVEDDQPTRDLLQELQDPQEPQSQDPKPDELDAATRQRIATLIKSMELPELRDTAAASLRSIGDAALPQIDTALAEEAERKRPDVVAALLHVRHGILLGSAAQRFGLPPGPITVAADYSDNRVVFVNRNGRVVRTIDEVFGVWDAELTPAGTLLMAEFSVSHVTEVDKDGNEVWVYDDLKNPYDADRLPNGNTLIADTFGGRVIEVTPGKKVVWEYTGVRPFDCDRLSNGNTLITDTLTDSVIEVDPSGTVVMRIPGMNNPHDADRLPNGNTLITLRSKGAVVEVDRDGKIVWELNGLSSPSDADRLPNGNTLVAENTQVREFGPDGAEVWRLGMTWAVEVGRY